MDANNSKQAVNVTLLGGARCGKTTALAVMERNFNEIYSKSSLKIENPENISVLDDKWDEITQYYTDRKNLKRSFIPDRLPTTDKTVYNFLISLKGRNMEPLSTNFIDFPGEWLGDESHINEIISSIKQSQVVFVAIDTPYLMECCESTNPAEIGPYNEDKNFSNKISDILIEAFSSETDPKMLVFIPTKCEKYIQRGRRDEIYKKIEAAYEKVIARLKSYNYNHYEIIIAPIESFGSIHFSRFESYNGEIRLNEYAMPAKAIYAFNDDAKNAPEPKNCEIPLEAVLLYLLNETKEVNEKSNESVSFLAKLLGFNKTASVVESLEMELKEQEKILRQRLKAKNQSEDIRIISDPYRIDK